MSRTLPHRSPGQVSPSPIIAQVGAVGMGKPFSRGFTLLEILVALAISAVVLLAVQTVFFGALRLQRTTSDALDAHLSLERALTLVRRDVDGLMIPGSTLAGPFQTSPSSGMIDEVPGDRISADFYTSSGKIDGWNPFSEVQRVAYYLAPSTDGRSNKTLVRAVTRNLLPAQDTTSETQSLLDDIAQAAFFYYDGNGWLDTWDSTATATLPSAIKLTLVQAVRPGEPAADPIELVMPVLVATPTSQTQAAAGAMP